MVGSIGVFDGAIFFFDPVVRKITHELYDDFEKSDFYKKYANWREAKEAPPVVNDDTTLVHEHTTIAQKSIKTLFIVHKDVKVKGNAPSCGHSDRV